jgi:DNA primase
MTIHLQKFVDRVRGHEARGTKDFVMSMNDAKDLHADITMLMLRLHSLQEAVVKSQQDEVISVQINGEPF